MSASLLRMIMDKTGKTVIDIASATKVHPSTIDRYLKGSNVHRSTETLLEQWVEKHSKENDPEASKAAG